MFINLKTDKPAWLISHDDSVVYSTEPAADHRHHTGTSAFEFFSMHREATRDEIDGITPKTKPKAGQPPKGSIRPKGSARKARKAAPPAPQPAGADKPPAAPAGAAGGES